MTNEEFNGLFRDRTRDFAVKVLTFLETVPVSASTRIMTYQLGKAGTSVGSNFRAFTRARSNNERFSKICIVVEEADESLYWFNLFQKTGHGNQRLLMELFNEGDEILRVTSSIKNTIYKQNH